METATLPQISSFIIRFVLEETTGEEKTYRGTIRHIQTAEEINFSEWHEATEFMHRFVQLAEFRTPTSPDVVESHTREQAPTSETLNT